MAPWITLTAAVAALSPSALASVPALEARSSLVVASRAQPRSVAPLQLLASSQAGPSPERPAEAPVALPQFSWRNVVPFALNPAALLPLPLLAALLFKLDVLGPAYSWGAPALIQGLLLTLP